MTEFQCIIFIFSICSIFHLIRILLDIINNTGIPETGCHTPYPERVHVSDRSIDPVKRICFLTGISRGFQIIKTTIQKATVISQSPSFAQRGLHDRGIHFHPCLIGAFPHASFHDHGPRTQISVLHGRNTSNHLYRFNIIGPDFPQVITTSYNIKLIWIQIHIIRHRNAIHHYRYPESIIFVRIQRPQIKLFGTCHITILSQQLSG